MPEQIAAWLSTDRLKQIREHTRDGRQHQRGADGFEVAHHVLPISPEELQNILNELIARRTGHGHH